MKLILFILLLALIQRGYSRNVLVNKLMAQMSIEEKCGQMTQITLDTITNCPEECSKPLPDGTPTGCTCPPQDDVNPINQTKLMEAILVYKVGSILNTAYDRAQKASVWQEIINTIQQAALTTRLEIPVLYGLDSIHGANYMQESTLFPQPLSMAATFNADIARQVGAITAMETRALGIPWNFNPVLDVGRQHLWPRLYETYGEDVYLSAHLGAAYIQGSQGDSLKNRTKVATCLKHFIGYSYPLNGRDRTLAWVPDVILREYFLPGFAKGVQAGAPTVMINSGNVNGMPGHANSYYMNTILKGELAFDGFTVSDWEDVIRLYTRDKLAESPEDAVRIAVLAGLDMSMVPFGYSFHGYCVSLAMRDAAFMSRVDDAVRRILLVKEKVGLFESDGVFPEPKDLQNIATKTSKDFNLQTARESIILAKNDDNFLPLSGRGKRILVAGTSGGNLRVLNGGWSYKWLGDSEDYFKQFAKESLTVFQAVQQKTNDPNEVIYSEGANFTHLIDLNETVSLAATVDLIVLCIGERTYAEVFGNIDDLALDKSQQMLADALIEETGKDVVLVYLGGRPRLITNIAENSKVKAVVLGFLPGNRGAEAIADILFGDYNPDGRLPITYPRSPNGQTPYDIRPLEDFYPNKYEYLYPFGHGLSYTKFNYSNLTVSSNIVNYPDDLVVTVDVTNVGDMAGKETVLLYLSDLVASISRPIKQVNYYNQIV